MATITQLIQRRRPDVRRIRSEEDAIAAVAEFLAQLNAFRTLASAAEQSLRSSELLSPSGLLGITVPSDAGGADITNASLSNLLSQIAYVDLTIAEAVAGHFTALDALRAAISPARAAVYFERALHGDSFAFVDTSIPIFELHNHQPLVAQTIASQASTDWIVIPLTRDKDRLLGIFQVPLEELGDVSADRLVALKDNRAQALSHAAFRWMVQTAIKLGWARQALSMELQGQQDRVFPTLLTAAVTIEAVAALLDRAGQALDVAQMSTSVDRAEAAALAACHAAALGDKLMDASANAVDAAPAVDEATAGYRLSPAQILEIFYRTGTVPELI